MSTAYAFFYVFLGLAVAGLAGVIMTQVLGVNFHFLALSFGFDAAATESLGMLDSMLKLMPIAITLAAVVGLIVNAYRSKYEM